MIRASGSVVLALASSALPPLRFLAVATSGSCSSAAWMRCSRCWAAHSLACRRRLNIDPPVTKTFCANWLMPASARTRLAPTLTSRLGRPRGASRYLALQALPVGLAQNTLE